MILDLEKTDPNTIYKLLIGSVLPRPIAWVSTVDKDGVLNLAPFSFFTVASANPPVLCFAPGAKEIIVDGQEKLVAKDTLTNVRQTGEFVVNIVSQNLAERMVQTSGEYPSDVDEFEAAGLTAIPSQMVAPPRVGESLINMECKLLQIVEFGPSPSPGALVLGRIVCMHLVDGVYKNGRVDLDVLQPIGRMSGSLYCRTADRFELRRPNV